MAKLALVKGTTSYTVNVFVPDSSSPSGAGLAGLVWNSAGLTAYYMRPRAASVAVTLATLTAVTSAWSSGGWKEIDSVNAPGTYRLDIPDAALASGADWVDVYLRGAANMAPVVLEIQLTGVDLNDATAGGLSRLDAAVSSRLASGNVTVGTNNDKTGYALTSAEHTLISGTDAPAALTAQGLTTARATKLDQLDAAVTSRQPSGAVALTSGERTTLSAALLDTDLATHLTPGTVGRALQIARAQGRGKWAIAGDVLTLYDVDNTTVIAALTLTPPGGPYTGRSGTAEAL